MPPSTGNGPKLTPGAVLTEIPKYLIDQALGMMGNFRLGANPKTRQGIPPVQPAPQQRDGTIPPMTDPNRPPTQAEQQALNAAGRVLNPVKREPWFGPLVPLRGQAPRGDVAGRAGDYPVAYNLSQTPRQYEPVSFRMIKGLFEGLDLAKLCVETRKNQMAKLSWEIMPMMSAGENVRKRDDPRCAQLEQFFRSPDRIHSWDVWMRMLLHEMMVTDAAAIYVRRTLGGDIYAFEVIDGTDIIPRIDALGRIPQPPEAAYSHILKGTNAINYTTDELIYFPRNLRAGRVYGNSPIELILMTIQIAIRRDITKLQYYTEGNIPDALIGVPADWSPEQIDRMQQIFDAWTSDQGNRRKAYFIPGGTSYNPTRNPQTLDPQQDEWLARVITFAFNLPNLPLVAQQNRATSETANDASLREGLAPTIVWLKGLMDLIIQKFFGFPDIEWVMDSAKEEDPDAASTRQIAEVRAGLLSGDEYRAERGKPAIGMKHAIFGIGPLGIMFVEDLLKAQAQGLLMPPSQPPPDAGMGPGMGAVSPYDSASAPPALLTGPASAGTPGSSSDGAPLMIPGTETPRPLALPAPPAHKPAVPAISNINMAELPPGLLAAVGLHVDHKKAARPVSTKKKQAPALVLNTLDHYESKFKSKR